MFTCIEGATADELWLNISDTFRSNHFESKDSRAGHTNELLHAALCIRDPRQRWVTSRTPAISPAFALAEVIWIMSGRRDSAFLNYFNKKLPRFAGAGPEYHGAYGFRLRSKFKTDQLIRAFNVLRASPSSRQVVLQIWDADSDLPDSQGIPVAPDIPCNICALLKVRDNRLDWVQIMRSNDVFRGLPYNIVQFTSLHEIMAGWLELELGHYHHISDSLHVYERDKQLVVNATPYHSPVNTDVLSTSYSRSLEILQTLERSVECIIASESTADTLTQNFRSLQLPEAWTNVAAVLFAEGCRVRGAFDAMHSIMRGCSNNLFQILVQRWNDRYSS